MNVKEYLEQNKNSNLTVEEIEKNAEIFKEKYNVIVPDDLKEFWLSTDGFYFESGGMIFGLTDEREYASIVGQTNDLKWMITDWEIIDYEVADFIVVGKIYEHGYILYFDNTKKYALIKDLADDYTLDGKDTNLLQFDTIYDVFVYFDYMAGEKIFEKEFEILFPEEFRKEKDYLESVAKRHLDLIEGLEKEVKTKKDIAINCIIDKQYKEIIIKEYKEVSWSIAIGDYELNKQFRIYINKETKELGIACDNKIETHNKYGLFGTPPIITEIINRDDYFVIKSDREHLEPIVVFKKWLDKKQIKVLKGLFEKSIIDKILRR